MLAFIARSGASAIAHDLAGHESIILRPEVFGLPDIAGQPQTDDNRTRWLEGLWKHRPAQAEISRGFRFRFDRHRPQFDDLPMLKATIGRLGPAVFNLRRDDRIRHTISVIHARAPQAAADHGEAHIDQAAPAEPPTAIDPAAFEQTAAELDAQAAYMSAFMDGLPGRVDISYEDYLGDRLAVLNAICGTVGVAPFGPPAQAAGTGAARGDWRDRVANHAEIAAVARRMGLAGQA